MFMASVLSPFFSKWSNTSKAWLNKPWFFKTETKVNVARLGLIFSGSDDFSIDVFWAFILNEVFLVNCFGPLLFELTEFWGFVCFSGDD